MKSVMLFGTFDILHSGHLYVFKKARKMGNVVVVVARDKRVEKLKNSPPIHTEKERMEMLRHIDLIDRVLLGNTRDVYAHIKKERPDIIVLGYDQYHYVDQLKSKCKDYGIKTKLVRLKPYNSSTYKSGKIRAKLFNQV